MTAQDLEPEWTVSYLIPSQAKIRSEKRKQQHIQRLPRYYKEREEVPLARGEGRCLKGWADNRVALEDAIEYSRGGADRSPELLPLVVVPMVCGDYRRAE